MLLFLRFLSSGIKYIQCLTLLYYSGFASILPILLYYSLFLVLLSLQLTACFSSCAFSPLVIRISNAQPFTLLLFCFCITCSHIVPLVPLLLSCTYFWLKYNSQHVSLPMLSLVKHYVLLLLCFCIACSLLVPLVPLP